MIPQFGQEFVFDERPNSVLLDFNRLLARWLALSLVLTLF